MELENIFITIIILGVLWFMYRSYKEDEELRIKKQNHTSKDVQKILNNIKNYSKKPYLRYRDMITSEELKKEFDKKLQTQKYQKILKNLKPNEISDELISLAMGIQKDDPEIQKKVDKILNK